MRLVLLFTAFAVLGSGVARSASGGPAGVVRGIAGKTLTCGLGASLHVDPKGNKLRWTGDGELVDNKLREANVALGPSNPVSATPDGIRFLLPAGSRERSLTLRRIPSARRRPDDGPNALELLVDDSQEGDTCVEETGLKPYLEHRFDAIRENLCGNDPANACIDILRRSCGLMPLPGCLASVRPKLEAVNRVARPGPARP